MSDEPRTLGFVRDCPEGRAVLEATLEDMRSRSLIIGGYGPDLRVEPDPLGQGWLIREYPPFFNG